MITDSNHDLSTGNQYPERYIPSENQYLDAFRAVYGNLTDTHKAILEKLYEHCYFMQDNRRVRTWELSEAAGYKGDSPGQIGVLGKRFCEFWGMEDETFGQPSLALINWFQDETSGHWYTELIPEAARAFKQFRVENGRH